MYAPPHDQVHHGAGEGELPSFPRHQPNMNGRRDSQHNCLQKTDAHGQVLALQLTQQVQRGQLLGVSLTGPGTSHYRRRTCGKKKNTSPLLSDRTVILLMLLGLPFVRAISSSLQKPSTPPEEESDEA